VREGVGEDGSLGAGLGQALEDCRPLSDAIGGALAQEAMGIYDHVRREAHLRLIGQAPPSHPEPYPGLAFRIEAGLGAGLGAGSLQGGLTRAPVPVSVSRAQEVAEGCHRSALAEELDASLRRADTRAIFRRVLASSSDALAADDTLVGQMASVASWSGAIDGWLIEGSLRLPVLASLLPAFLPVMGSAGTGQ
jgi:hypothetical protein